MIKTVNLIRRFSAGDSSVTALDGVSFSADYGEFVSVIGESGSGKSTLMNILGCLDSSAEGEYYLGGEDVFHISDNKKSLIRNTRIGFIFQSFNLIPSLTAEENVMLPLQYRGMRLKERRELAEQALSLVGLSHRSSHKPSELSGGQQQRVAVARAIAANPPLILADEPCGNLDGRSGAEIMNVLLSCAKSGKTVVLITHNPEQARQADRVVRIHDGRIVV